VPEFAVADTVTVNVAIEVPHTVVTEYEIVVVPRDTPVTLPPASTVALALLALHTPPETEAESVIVDPGQI